MDKLPKEIKNLIGKFVESINLKCDFENCQNEEDLTKIEKLLSNVSFLDKAPKEVIVKNENLSNEIKKNTYLYQRTIESNYPLRIFDKSKFVFFYISETNPSGCKIVETGEHLKLLQC